jgi:hypothetical protein
MRRTEKRPGWSWRQIRVVHALVAAALADPTNVDPEMVLDEITDVACFDGLEPVMNEQLAAWEARHLKR